jgi:ABC-type phosphate/phosphonate transport system substrate-binding protein
MKEVARSTPFPPVVVAYQDGALDARTRQRFRQGLLDAGKKKKGEVLLMLFKLTGFEAVPDDFDRVTADTRKHFPPPEEKR